MLSKTFARSAKNQGPRPRSRTLKAVQEAILEVCLCDPPVCLWGFSHTALREFSF